MSHSFPLEVVFRIYDNVLASGIEAIFAFSIMLLQKNEEALLSLKFDETLAFMKTRMFEQYIVRNLIYGRRFSAQCLSGSGCEIGEAFCAQ